MKKNTLGLVALFCLALLWGGNAEAKTKNYACLHAQAYKKCIANAQANLTKYSNMALGTYYYCRIQEGNCLLLTCRGKKVSCVKKCKKLSNECYKKRNANYNKYLAGWVRAIAITCWEKYRKTAKRALVVSKNGKLLKVGVCK